VEPIHLEPVGVWQRQRFDLRGDGSRDHFSAIATASEVLDHEVSLGSTEGALGKGGEQIGIGMRVCGWRLQPLYHDFGDTLHLQLPTFTTAGKILRS
jgi:hypothetical protein